MHVLVVVEVDLVGAAAAPNPDGVRVLSPPNSVVPASGIRVLDCVTVGGATSAHVLGLGGSNSKAERLISTKH